MSFIYNLSDTWNNILTTFNSILMDASDGSGGSAVGKADSRLISLRNNGTEVFGVDILGNILSTNGNLLNNINRIITTAGITDAYNGSSVLLTGAAFYTVSFSAVGNYTDGFKVFLYNGDTRAKYISIPGITSMKLWPKTSMIVGVKTGAFFYTKPPRYPLEQNTTMYLDSALGLDTNDGLVAGAGGALQTCNAMVAQVIGEVDCRTNQITIQHADGTYTGGYHFSGPAVGEQGHAGVLIRGNTANPQLCVVTGALSLFDKAWIRVEGLKVDGLYCQSFANMRVSGNMILNSTDFQMVAVDNSSIIIEQPNIINIDVANCNGWVSCQDMSIVQCSNMNINFAQATAFAAYGVGVQYQGAAYFRGTTFSGSGCTGTRYAGFDDGRIGTAGGGPNFLPGSGAGAVQTGATYN